MQGAVRKVVISNKVKQSPNYPNVISGYHFFVPYRNGVHFLLCGLLLLIYSSV